jgi:hypothetical protein
LQNCKVLTNIYSKDILNFFRRYFFNNKGYQATQPVIDAFEEEIRDRLIVSARQDLDYFHGFFQWNEKGTQIPWRAESLESDLVCYIPLDRQHWEFWYSNTDYMTASFGEALLYEGKMFRKRPAPTGCHSFIQLEYKYV